MESVLLSADYAAESLKARISKIFHCKTLNHYGSTEMGYGGALECGNFGGLHVRAPDLYFEIIDPKSGKPAPPGEEGELVLTTLTRRGMPLIRYRTGDFSRFVPGSCECGQITPRFAKPWRKKGGLVDLGGRTVSMPELDEILFSDRQVADYSASFEFSGRGRGERKFDVELKIWGIPGEGLDTGVIGEKAARAFPGCARIAVAAAPEGEPSPGTSGKRVFLITQ
jgi:hypothetical protein